MEKHISGGDTAQNTAKKVTLDREKYHETEKNNIRKSKLTFERGSNTSNLTVLFTKVYFHSYSKVIPTY